MGAYLINKQVVTNRDGVLALIINVDNKHYTTLVSDIVPNCRADIKHFQATVLGTSEVFNDDDYKPLNGRAKSPEPTEGL